MQTPVHGEKQLKYACEECHSRKVRCYAPPNTELGVCTPCYMNGRKCLFALKSKTGRPRRASRRPSELGESTSTTTTNATMAWEQSTSDSSRHSQSSRGKSNGSSQSDPQDLIEDQSTMSLPPQSFNSGSMLPSGDPMDTTNTFGHLLDFQLSDSELFAPDLSDFSSGTSGQDFMFSDPFSFPTNTFARSRHNSSRSSSDFSDHVGSSVSYEEAVNMSHMVHRHLLQVQRDGTSLLSTSSTSQLSGILMCFDRLSGLLTRVIDQSRGRGHKGTLPQMTATGALCIAVLDAILLCSTLVGPSAVHPGFCGDPVGDSAMPLFDLLEDDPKQNVFREIANLYSASSQPSLRMSHQPGYWLDSNYSPGTDLHQQHPQMRRHVSDSVVHARGLSPPLHLNTGEGMKNLDHILNLTKIEYYIATFKQFLHLFFQYSRPDTMSGVGNASPDESLRLAFASQSIFESTVCLKSLDDVQGQVRLALTHTRQQIHT